MLFKDKQTRALLRQCKSIQRSIIKGSAITAGNKLVDLQRDLQRIQIEEARQELVKLQCLGGIGA